MIRILSDHPELVDVTPDGYVPNQSGQDEFRELLFAPREETPR